MSPCISVTTEVVIDSHYTSTGHLQHCLRVPRLAVATAVLRLAPDIVDMGSRDELGLLLGFLGFEAALNMPALQSGSGRSSSPDLKLHCCRFSTPAASYIKPEGSDDDYCHCDHQNQHHCQWSRDYRPNSYSFHETSEKYLKSDLHSSISLCLSAPSPHAAALLHTHMS